ncbi:hypothetical protein AB4Z29_21685 [Paenibacillus sp. 2TAB23]|uniref:hypothetical protein n=1 Tax=Paenibacillus sp. 2TAB23 TaxID=3233004 RepID=UPI003F99117A
MITKFVSIVMGILFYRSPLLIFSPHEAMEYDKMYSEAVSGNLEIMYTSIYPKYRFIHYISSTKPVVLHGSNNTEIMELKPRRQTLYNGQYVEAVFATRDGIWSLFYAVFDRNKLVGHFRNACLKVRNNNNNYYFFSLTPDTMSQKPWTKGVVYFLPQDTFERAKNALVSFDEWISNTPVKPIAKMTVEPEDFYYINKVSSHQASESLFISWFLYKRRVKRSIIAASKQEMIIQKSDK